jgi:hypothetical protein
LVQFFISLMHGDWPVTAYFVPWESVQHLSPPAAHVLPQHWPPDAQGKWLPSSFSQQVPPAAMHASPQHEEFCPQGKAPPFEFAQQVPPTSMHVSPQQVEPLPQVKSTPSLLVHGTESSGLSSKSRCGGGK